jgi:hypothetical protein
MTDAIQIITPPVAETPLDDMLVELTRLISLSNPDIVAHGCLGGEFGYGARYENDVFYMMPDYQDVECECGHHENAAEWHRTHPHSEDCYSSELDRRIQQYKDQIGYSALECAVYGERGFSFLGGMTVERHTDGICRGMIMTPRTDDAMKALNRADKKLRQFQEHLYRELCKKHGRTYPHGCAVHCTCFKEEAAKTWFAQNDHNRMCPVVRPNFWHKKSGFEVRWYKWIGRDMEIKNQPINLTTIFDECAASITMAAA